MVRNGICFQSKCNHYFGIWNSGKKRVRDCLVNDVRFNDVST